MFLKWFMITCILVTRHIQNAVCVLWLIPEADICNENGYFFKQRVQCMYATGREHYCIGRDEHLCGLRDSGNLTGYYQVECG
jgi:hypothetical protein